MKPKYLEKDFTRTLSFERQQEYAKLHMLKKQKEKQAMEEMVMKIAKRDGLVFDEYKLDTKFYPSLIKAIFLDEENEEHSEDILFEPSKESILKRIKQFNN